MLLYGPVVLLIGVYIESHYWSQIFDWPSMMTVHVRAKILSKCFVVLDSRIVVLKASYLGLHIGMVLGCK